MTVSLPGVGATTGTGPLYQDMPIEGPGGGSIGAQLDSFLDAAHMKLYGTPYPAMNKHLTVAQQIADLRPLLVHDTDFTQKLGNFFNYFEKQRHSRTYQYSPDAVVRSFKTLLEQAVGNTAGGVKKYPDLGAYLESLHANLPGSEQTGSITEAQWARDLLKMIGAKPGPNNVDNILRWMKGESTGQKGGFLRDNNPVNLNTSTSQHAAITDYGGTIGPEFGIWVQKWPNMEAGLKAMAKMLLSGIGPAGDHFTSQPSVVSALRQDVGPSAFGTALSHSAWASGGYASAQGILGYAPVNETATGAVISGGGGGPFGGSPAVTPSGTTAVHHKIYTDIYGNPAITNPTASEVNSAYGRIHLALENWGLADPTLTKMAFERAVAGEDYAQILIDIRKTPQYNAAFPGLSERAKNNLPPMTETQYLSYERAMETLATKYALPRGFISKREIGKLVAMSVSPAEFNQRLRDLSAVAYQADPLVKRQFEHYFGVKNALGALTAYFANPHRATSILNEQLQAAEFGAQSATSGLGNLSKHDAMSLAHYEYLHTPGSVATAIDNAANMGYLRAGAPGSVAPRVSTNQLLGSEVAGYGHTSLAGAREAVRGAEAARESFLNAGGGFEATAKGVRGAGSASTEGVGP